jgi:hypothetical protein
MNAAGSTETVGGAILAAAPAPLPLGRLGRFVLHEPLGRGGFGVVYRAYDPLLDRELALKVPLFPTGEQKRAERFLNEARAAARLRHPNIVAVYESGEADGLLYLAAEYVQGQTLAETLEKSGAEHGPSVLPDGGHHGLPSAVPLPQAVLWVRDLAGALEYAHSQEVVHRDIKPQNIMIDDQGRPQIMDFGLAKRLDQDSKTTLEGALLGTPAYMSPEQARGEIDKVGPASDQYSLGAVLYEMITGQKPFDGPAVVVIARAANEEPPAPRTINPQLPQDLEAICLKAMHPDVDGRYAGLLYMAADLDNWLHGEAVVARPLGRLTRMRRWMNRQPLVAALTAAVALLLVVAAVGGPAGYSAALRSRNEADDTFRQRDIQKQRTSAARLNAKQRAQEAQEATSAVEEAAETATSQAQMAQAEFQRLEEATRLLEITVNSMQEEERKLAIEVAGRKVDEINAEDAAKELEAVNQASAKRADAVDATMEQAYGHMLKSAEEALDKKDFDRLAQLAGVWPPEHRHWGWRFLKAVAAAQSLSTKTWVLYSLSFKEDRGVKLAAPIGSIRWNVQSRDSRTRPDWDEDPEWVHYPPAVVDCYATDGVPQVVSPTGKVLVTTEPDGWFYLWDIAANDVPVLLASRKSPFGVVVVPQEMQDTESARKLARNPKVAKKVKDQHFVGYAFTRDGRRVAQLSLHPDDLSPSPIRMFTVPTGKGRPHWENWPPPVDGRAALAAEIEDRGGGPDALIRLFNEGAPDRASQLLNGEELANNQEGVSVGLDSNLRLRLEDREKHVLSIESGLNPVRFLERRNIQRGRCHYTIEQVGYAWSTDRNRLLLHVHLLCSYVWAFQGQTRPLVETGQGVTRNIIDPSTVTPLWTNPIHFDIVIVYSAT